MARANKNEKIRQVRVAEPLTRDQLFVAQDRMLKRIHIQLAPYQGASDLCADIKALTGLTITEVNSILGIELPRRPLPASSDDDDEVTTLH